MVKILFLLLTGTLILLSMGDLPILERKVDFSKKNRRLPAKEEKEKKPNKELKNGGNNHRENQRKSSGDKKTI